MLRFRMDEKTLCIIMSIYDKCFTVRVELILGLVCILNKITAQG